MTWGRGGDQYLVVEDKVAGGAADFRTNFSHSCRNTTTATLEHDFFSVWHERKSSQ
ncbi:hypothetical protein Mapa_008375 [Marchantia paleacea]|nr:hypothetical protein Mapa_008375 [Marchantia paleacea]